MDNLLTSFELVNKPLGRKRNFTFFLFHFGSLSLTHSLNLSLSLSLSPFLSLNIFLSLCPPLFLSLPLSLCLDLFFSLSISFSFFHINAQTQACTLFLGCPFWILRGPFIINRSALKGRKTFYSFPKRKYFWNGRFDSFFLQNFYSRLD